jgi:hypothetical protein
LSSIGTAKNWFYDEAVRVGSFTAPGEIPGLFNGKANVLAPGAASMPLPLPRRDHAPSIWWNTDLRKNLTVDATWSASTVR